MLGLGGDNVGDEEAKGWRRKLGGKGSAHEEYKRCRMCLHRMRRVR